MRKLVGWTVFVTVLALISAPALAAKGGNKGKPSAQVDIQATISVDQADLRHGDVATFTATYAAMRTPAMIWVRCWQGGEWVYQNVGSEQAEFHLTNSNWRDEQATCTADLYFDVYQGQTLVSREWLAQTSFGVGA